jgi:hypothetical protein
MYNNLKLGFCHPYNIIFLAACTAVSGALVSLDPIGIGLGIEAVYLGASGISPKNSAFHRFILTKPFGDLRLLRQRTPIEKVNKQNVLPGLSAEAKEQYATLEFHCKSIRSVIDADTPSGKDISTSLDYLLNKFLLFAVRRQEFREQLDLLVEESRNLAPETAFSQRPHLTIVGDTEEKPREESIAALASRAHAGYAAEVERVNNLLAAGSGSDDSVRNTERLHILRRRLRHVDHVSKAIQNVSVEINHIGLKIQSMNEDNQVAAPVQAAKDLRGLIVETDSVTKTIERVEPLEELEISARAA